LFTCFLIVRDTPWSFVSLYGFYPIGHRQWELRHLRDVPLSPAATADLNFSQNADKSDCAKAFGKNNRSKIPANQVCTRITRINANEFRFDKAFFALRGIICGEAFEKQDAVRSWVGDN
jgi:hypothetical protein